MTPTVPVHRPTPDGRDSESQQINLLMDRGIAAARAGQRARADACFEAAIRLDPTCEEAWLWRAGIAAAPDRSMAYLNHVLSINPHNEAALAGLAWARRRSRTETAGEQTWVVQRDDRPALVSSLRERPSESDSHPALESPAENAALGWLTVVTGLLAVLVLAVIGGMFLLFSDFTTPALAEVSPPTSTATAVPPATLQAAAPATASATASPTLTSTPEPTLTHTPTVTETPSSTPSPSPTPTTPFTPDPAVAPAAGAGEKWINVSLADQHLIAYEGDQPVFEAPVSTGLPRTPTVKGTFRIYQKLVSTTMSGPDYYLPNVLYTQYFYKGYALHGAYWHDNFGQPMSHGCINLRNEDAEWLFEWTEPSLPAGARHIQSSEGASGTLVVIQ